MFTIAAVFPPGFEKAVPPALTRAVPDAAKIAVSSGFVRFCVGKKPFRAADIDFFNNSLLVIKEWTASRAPAFAAMASRIGIPSPVLAEIAARRYKTFRLRFSAENAFVSVGKSLAANAEAQIARQTGLAVNRLGGDAEFWFLTRADGYACFALRMTRRAATEKSLHKGELRPEFASLLAELAGVPRLAGGVVLLDPFAGYGGIVKQLCKSAPRAKIIASELDATLVQDLRKNRACSAAEIHAASAENLDFLADASVDAIITDPPWGFFQGDLRDDKKLAALYCAMLREFFRVIKPAGTLCVLTGAKAVFEGAFALSPFAALGDAASFRTDVLVNGKKSAVYVWRAAE